MNQRRVTSARRPTKPPSAPPMMAPMSWLALLWLLPPASVVGECEAELANWVEVNVAVTVVTCPSGSVETPWETMTVWLDELVIEDEEADVVVEDEVVVVVEDVFVFVPVSVQDENKVAVASVSVKVN